MRILGVDPGSHLTGWGLLSGSARDPQVVECGVIRLSESLALADRLAALHREFEGLVRRLRPEEAAVEAPFHGANARSAFQLAHARGVVLAVLGAEAIAVAEYAPAAVKKAVTGSGRAEKVQVQAMVKRLLGPGAGTGPHDVADALAVALCHGATVGFRAAVARGAAGAR